MSNSELGNSLENILGGHQSWIVKRFKIYL